MSETAIQTTVVIVTAMAITLAGCILIEKWGKARTQRRSAP